MHAASELIVALTCLLSPWLGPQDSRPPVSDSARSDGYWVTQLGHPSYRTRTKAAEVLLERGLSARSALLDGLKQPDLEIRLAAHKLLVEIMHTDFEARLERFVKDNEPLELPGWKPFADLIGDDLASRRAFADILRHEGPLLDAFAKTPEVAEDQFVTRMSELQQRAMNSKNRIAPASLAGVLFVGGFLEREDLGSASSRLYSLLMNRSVQQQIQNHGGQAVTRRLMDHWLSTGVEGHEAYMGFMICLNYELSETGLRLAQQALKTGKATGSRSLVIQYAAYVVGKFGTIDDAQLLAEYLDETALVSNHRNGKLQLKTQLRDIILAMLIHLHGLDHADFGFGKVQPNPLTVYAPYSLGFASEEMREQAHAKWQAYAKKLQAAEAGADVE